MKDYHMSEEPLLEVMILQSIRTEYASCHVYLINRIFYSTYKFHNNKGIRKDQGRETDGL